MTSRIGLRQARSLGKPIFDLHGRGELLALTYSVGGLAVVIAWLVDPSIVGNRPGLACVLAFVFLTAVAMYVLKERLPRHTGDVAIVGSLALIDLALFFTKIHAYPGLLGPFYVWVGFASPLWFPRRRAIVYALLAIVASGIVVLIASSADAVAAWVITMATLIVAFCITSFLTDALVKRERLAVVGEMASVVGHDLRNPLGAVSNALYLLRFSLDDDATVEQERHLQMATREIGKASAIIDHLGSYVRPGEPFLSKVDLGALVAEVLEVISPRDGIEVSVNVEPITLLADRGQLDEILTNLVTNAYDALANGGKIHISAHIEGRTAVIEVKDNGPGIDRALAERIFEPFFTTKHRGTGLGLAIVRRLVEGHGGSVRVEGSSSSGTLFCVRLPYREPPEQEGTTGEPAELPPRVISRGPASR